ncbi:MAG: phage major capsid protein [Candidatus Bathyarchaeia archaeon]
MDEKIIEQLEDKFKKAVDEVFEQRLAKTISPLVAEETKKIVNQLRVERALFGTDRTGLTPEQKKEFAERVKSVALGIRTKANEALIEEQDSRGGYLVPVEVANAIERIAASVGLILSQAKKWPMKSDELDIPAYTGSFLTGDYLDVDTAGSLTGLTFSQARLIAKKWQLAFVVGNDLLADASVDLADWLLALGGEALANMIDKQGFVGTGAPFVGILNHDGVTTLTMDSGKNTFQEIDLDECSKAISNLEESLLDGAAFYFHRTVWHELRTKKDSAGQYIAGYPTPQLLELAAKAGAPKPVGMLWGYPVYTCQHLPSTSESAASTKFAVFGNLKAMAFGSKDELRVGQFQSGYFGSKEIALADQTGLVYKNRHALAITLPAAFVAIKTAAS